MSLTLPRAHGEAASLVNRVVYCSTYATTRDSGGKRVTRQDAAGARVTRRDGPADENWVRG